MKNEKSKYRENLEIMQMIEDMETKVAQREHWKLQRWILIGTFIIAVFGIIYK